MMKHYATLVALLIVSASAIKVNYDGHMVIRTTPETEEQLKFLHQLESAMSLDFWAHPGNVNQPADIRVSPQSYYDVARSLAEEKMQHKIIIEDLGQRIKEEEQEIVLRRAISGKAFDFNNYYPYEDIVNHLNELAATYSFMTVKKAGVTQEGRDIVQVVISTPNGPPKPVIFFDCNIHAREWITAATCMWIIEHLVTGYGVNGDVTALVNTHDWKFVPITNPDGYAYTWQSDRLWRKNRVPNSNSSCVGVDVNRNFPVGWGIVPGSSPLPCDESYHGSSAFSEVESQTLRDLLAEDRDRVLAAFSIHSFSQLWLSPLGYTLDLPPQADYDENMRVMAIGVNALTGVYGTRYEYGNTAATIYVATGITTDHYYVNEKILHSYTLELRDTGTYGFILPPDQIIPTAEETWEGLKAAIRAM